MKDNFFEGTIFGYGVFFIITSLMYFIFDIPFGFAEDLEMIISIIIGLTFIITSIYLRHRNLKEIAKGGSMNIYKIWAIIVTIILIGVGLFLGYNYNQNTKLQIAENNFNLGYNQGQYELTDYIGKTGNIPYLDNSTGNQTVKTINIQNLCKTGQ